MASHSGGPDLYALAIDQVDQNQQSLGRSSLTNLDELLNALPRQASSTLLRDPNNNQVNDEDIQQAGSDQSVTLEDFLVKAGIAGGYNVSGAGPVSVAVLSGRKRPVGLEGFAERTVERRQKRMMKNRESAARSRARKQAYTHELEIKVSHLEEENERLRREVEIKNVLPCSPPPKPKNKLRRTSSAIF